MLKLEKTSHHLSTLTIRMREKDRFFEPQLLKALAIAFFLHILSLILFHITPFYLSSTFTFPPIQVQSTLPTEGVSAIVSHYIEEEEPLPPPLIFAPELNWISFSHESILSPAISLDLDTFQSLEEHRWPKWNEPASPLLEEPYIQLTISGDLALLPLIEKDPLLDQTRPIEPSESITYVTYQVQLDDKTGELFWYERIESSSLMEMNQLTESILLHLRFASPKSEEIVKGTLNFAVRLVASKGN